MPTPHDTHAHLRPSRLQISRAGGLPTNVGGILVFQFSSQNPGETKTVRQKQRTVAA